MINICKDDVINIILILNIVFIFLFAYLFYRDSKKISIEKFNEMSQESKSVEITPEYLEKVAYQLKL
jgi:hypothetical protein